MYYMYVCVYVYTREEIKGIVLVVRCVPRSANA
jgi:hypothetical protein